LVAPATRPPTPAATTGSFALLTLGEGWHKQPSSLYGFGAPGLLLVGKSIFTYYTLKILSWFGIVWDLRKVPTHLLTKTDSPPNPPPQAILIL